MYVPGDGDKVTRGQELGSLSMLGPTFLISFQFWIGSYTSSSEWSEIIKITDSGNTEVLSIMVNRNGNIRVEKLNYILDNEDETLM